MSLALIQSYSSADEDADNGRLSSSSSSLNDSDHNDGEVADSRVRDRWRRHDPPPSSDPHNSLLPSAFDAFAEVAGPPVFLSNCTTAVEEEEPRPPGLMDRRGKHKSRQEKKELPAGVVVEAKAQLTGIRDRVRSDVEGSSRPSGSVGITSTEGKRVISASNPDAKDAAELLRMCLQCGIPKTYSHARGMVCPVCGDRPLPDPTKEVEKKKGSTIKDKEKNKRMKGQSSHASWKSETEMQLRQQFD